MSAARRGHGAGRGPLARGDGECVHERVVGQLTAGLDTTAHRVDDTVHYRRAEVLAGDGKRRPAGPRVRGRIVDVMQGERLPAGLAAQRVDVPAYRDGSMSASRQWQVGDRSPRAARRLELDYGT